MLPGAARAAAVSQRALPLPLLLLLLLLLALSSPNNATSTTGAASPCAASASPILCLLEAEGWPIPAFSGSLGGGLTLEVAGGAGTRLNSVTLGVVVPSTQGRGAPRLTVPFASTTGTLGAHVRAPAVGTVSHSTIKFSVSGVATFEAYLGTDLTTHCSASGRVTTLSAKWSDPLVQPGVADVNATISKFLFDAEAPAVVSAVCDGARARIAEAVRRYTALGSGRPWQPTPEPPGPGTDPREHPVYRLLLNESLTKLRRPFGYRLPLAYPATEVLGYPLRVHQVDVAAHTPSNAHLDLYDQFRIDFDRINATLRLNLTAGPGVEVPMRLRLGTSGAHHVLLDYKVRINASRAQGSAATPECVLTAAEEPNITLSTTHMGWEVFYSSLELALELDAALPLPPGHSRNYDARSGPMRDVQLLAAVSAFAAQLLKTMAPAPFTPDPATLLFVQWPQLLLQAPDPWAAISAQLHDAVADVASRCQPGTAEPVRTDADGTPSGYAVQRAGVAALIAIATLGLAILAHHLAARSRRAQKRASTRLGGGGASTNSGRTPASAATSGGDPGGAAAASERRLLLPGGEAAAHRQRLMFARESQVLAAQEPIEGRLMTVVVVVLVWALSEASAHGVWALAIVSAPGVLEDRIVREISATDLARHFESPHAAAACIFLAAYWHTVVALAVLLLCLLPLTAVEKHWGLSLLNAVSKLGMLNALALLSLAPALCYQGATQLETHLRPTPNLILYVCGLLGCMTAGSFLVSVRGYDFKINSPLESLETAPPLQKAWTRFTPRRNLALLFLVCLALTCTVFGTLASELVTYRIQGVLGWLRADPATGGGSAWLTMTAFHVYYQCAATPLARLVAAFVFLAIGIAPVVSLVVMLVLWIIPLRLHWHRRFWLVLDLAFAINCVDLAVVAAIALAAAGPYTLGGAACGDYAAWATFLDAGFDEADCAIVSARLDPLGVSLVLLGGVLHLLAFLFFQHLRIRSKLHPLRFRRRRTTGAGGGGGGDLGVQ